MTNQIHVLPILRDNYCFIIETADKNCIVIDPGQVSPIEIFLQAHGLTPTLILNTHHHADHVAGNSRLKELYKINVIGPKAEEGLIPSMDKGVKEGDTLSHAGLDFQIIATPGHTNGHIVFYVPALGALFSGDTLFSLGCGRLLEGGPQDMYESLQKIKSLPADTMVYCGHEYTQANGEFALHVDPANDALIERINKVRKLRLNNQPTIPVSLALELRTNPFLMAKDKDRFAELRAMKDNF